jgi:hypothetical protein
VSVYHRPSFPPEPPLPGIPTSRLWEEQARAFDELRGDLARLTSENRRYRDRYGPIERTEERNMVAERAQDTPIEARFCQRDDCWGKLYKDKDGAKRCALCKKIGQLEGLRPIVVDPALKAAIPLPTDPPKVKAPKTKGPFDLSNREAYETLAQLRDRVQAERDLVYSLARRLGDLEAELIGILSLFRVVS